MSNQDNNEKLQKALEVTWKIITAIFGILFALVVGVCAFIWELMHINDEEYQARKMIKDQYRRKQSWVESASAKDILDDWRIKAGGMVPETRQQAEVLQKMKANPEEQLTKILDQGELDVLIEWILKMLGII